jgi:hypothetical protein
MLDSGKNFDNMDSSSLYLSYFSFGQDIKSFLHGEDFWKFDEPDDFESFKFSSKPLAFEKSIKQIVKPGKSFLFFLKPNL